jgi:uncharacterized protein
MADPPRVTCDGCSACCSDVGHPPFLLELNSGVPLPIGGADSQADYQRLLAAPAVARNAYLATVEAVGRPCEWLDATARRCRYYEFRPDICRSFEVGAKWCSQSRDLLDIK